MAKIEPLALNEQGNGAGTASLTIDVADAPMLVHALMIATTALRMCHKDSAARRMKYYQDRMRDICPVGWDHFRDEEDLCEIALAMSSSPSWSLQKIARRWVNEPYDIRIEVGSEFWTLTDCRGDAITDVERLLDAIAPIGCEHRQGPDGVMS